MLAGGSPVRVLRLTLAGSRQVAAWFAGAQVPDGTGARLLARRLLDAGIAHPDLAARDPVRSGRGAPRRSPTSRSSSRFVTGTRNSTAAWPAWAISRT